jgi:L-seryl-tRNA(Ser) seleniumtransferase
MLMKVHASNYAIQGFTHAVPESELAELAHRNGLPFVIDLGSGTLADLAAWGLPHEPTPAEAIAAGADLVTFSGDKLLGGPQAGLLVGRRTSSRRSRRIPLKRALRVGKLTLAALEAVLALYRDPDRLHLRRDRRAAIDPARSRDPCRRRTPVAGPANRAGRPAGDGGNRRAQIADRLRLAAGRPPALGRLRDPAARQEGRRAQPHRAALRALPKPVIGRIEDGALLLDLRCLQPQEEAEFAATLAALDVRK